GSGGVVAAASAAGRQAKCRHAHDSDAFGDCSCVVHALNYEIATGRDCQSLRGVILVFMKVSSTLSDEALLAGLAAGQPEAAAAFIRRFQARVYGLVITIVR